MTASEIRALFAVASRPEVVSLAGGMPYIAALPLDAVGEMLGRLVAEHGATALQYGIGQGMPRAARADLRGDGRCPASTPPGRLAGRRRGHRRRAAGARPGRPALPRPGRRGARRGPDLRRRARRVPGRAGTGRARADGRRRADPGGAGGGHRRRRPAPAGGSSSSTRSRPTRTRPASPSPRSGASRCSTSASGPACSSSRTTRTGGSASRARRRGRCGPAAATGVFYLSTFSKTFAPGPAGGLDPRAARRTRQAGDRHRGEDPLPERLRPGRGHHVPVAPCRGASSSRSYREIYRERRDALLDRAGRPDARRAPPGPARPAACSSGRPCPTASTPRR